MSPSSCQSHDLYATLRSLIVPCSLEFPSVPQRWALGWVYLNAFSLYNLLSLYKCLYLFWFYTFWPLHHHGWKSLFLRCIWVNAWGASIFHCYREFHRMTRPPWIFPFLLLTNTWVVSSVLLLQTRLIRTFWNMPPGTYCASFFKALLGWWKCSTKMCMLSSRTAIRLNRWTSTWNVVTVIFILFPWL